MVINWCPTNPKTPTAKKANQPSAVLGHDQKNGTIGNKQMVAKMPT